MFTVYKISNKFNGKSYIGVTSKSIEDRWKRHVWGALKGGLSLVLCHAIRKYGEDSFDIKQIDIARLWEEAEGLEKMYIEKFRTKVPTGYNMTDGGGGVSGLDEGAREKISRAHKGKIVSEAAREKMSKSHRGISFSLERRRNMALAKKGHLVSKETRDKISRANNGHLVSKETREKISVSQKLRFNSQEARDKLSIAQKRRFSSFKEREKISKALIGKCYITSEGRKRISEANKHPKSPETIERMKRYQRNMTAEHRRNISIGRKLAWKRMKEAERDRHI